jgi:hypothetical protein
MRGRDERRRRVVDGESQAVRVDVPFLMGIPEHSDEQRHGCGSILLQKVRRELVRSFDQPLAVRWLARHPAEMRDLRVQNAKDTDLDFTFPLALQPRRA